MKRSAGYPLEQCALYRVTSPEMLAARLSTEKKPINAAYLDALATRSDNYSIREQEKPGGGIRKIEEPKANLQAIHGRIHDLLSRVELPDYVHSVRKGRSYITNALEHVGRGELVKIDVEKFYPSIRRGAVFEFFHHQMQCAGDVSGLLARLLTMDGHLPTGSKSSPILSYFVNHSMFDEIAAYTHARGLILTVYVDDLTISGPGANNAVLHGVRKIIAEHRLRSHKLKQFGKKRTKIVTGIVVASGEIRLPNRRHQRIHESYDRLHAASTPEEKLSVLNRLCSQVHEAAQIEWRYRPRAVQLEELRRSLRILQSSKATEVVVRSRLTDHAR